MWPKRSAQEGIDDRRTAPQERGSFAEKDVDIFKQRGSRNAELCLQEDYKIAFSSHVTRRLESGCERYFR